jgi:hypothetical protein
LGYTESRDILIEYRFAEGVAERYAALLADLVALKPAVVLVGSTGAIMTGCAPDAAKWSQDDPSR